MREERPRGSARAVARITRGVHRMLKRIWAVGFVFVFATISTTAQRVLVTWTRTNFEVGVQYPAVEIGTVTIADCTLDGFSNTAGSEGGGTGIGPLSHNAPQKVIFYNGMNRGVVDPGMYILFAAPHYPAFPPGSY